MSKKFGPARLIAVASVAVTSFFVSGCTPAPVISPDPVTVSSHTDEQVAPELEQYYKQDVTWTPCGPPDDLQCAELAAPLDWAKPEGSQITLAIARRAAPGDYKASLLINPGGPGGSGIDYVRGFQGSPRILANYDLVGFDPRGVGASTPIVCLTSDKDRDEMLYGTPDAAYGSDAWETEIAERQKTWVDACVENTGELLAHIDSVSVSRDLDMMRAVLGDDKLNYLGLSFGTYLGTIYAELFPEKVGQMVLDGAVEPPYGTFEASLRQAAGFDRAFAAYMKNCLESSDCPFDAPLRSALKQAHNLIVSVDKKELIGSDGRRATAPTVAGAIAYGLYDSASWPSITELFSELEDDKVDKALQLADWSNERLPDGSYYGRIQDVLLAVNCAEGSVRDDEIDLPTGLDKIDRAAPYLGSIMALDGYAVTETTCSQWPYPRPEFPTEFDAEGAPPILVIGTTNDPATPYEQAVTLASELSSGVLVTLNGEEHTAYNRGNACIDSVVDAFMVDGTVPTTDPQC